MISKKKGTSIKVGTKMFKKVPKGDMGTLLVECPLVKQKSFEPQLERIVMVILMIIMTIMTKKHTITVKFE